MVLDKLEEILQAAEEIETSSTATLDACGFSDEGERLAFIHEQARIITQLAEQLLYDRGD